MDLRVWADFVENELTANNFRPTNNNLDREIVEENPCDHCGDKCRYAGFANEFGNYRAFAICDTCRTVQEF